MRTSFRVINLAKPNMTYMYKSYLFMERFTLPDDTAELLRKFLDEFRRLKHEKLYKDKLP